MPQLSKYTDYLSLPMAMNFNKYLTQESVNTFILVITDSEHVHYENWQATAKLVGGANVNEANKIFADTTSSLSELIL